MIPAGYMLKHTARPDWLRAPQVVDLYSVSGCAAKEFADFIGFWRHNGHWLFDSPAVLQELMAAHAIPRAGLTLFYYEVHELQWDGEQRRWLPFAPEPSLVTDVVVPAARTLEGFDVVTCRAGNGPECSPLSCNGLCETMATNAHCLLPSFEEAERALEAGRFDAGEPGPYRIYAVYSVPEA